MEEEQIIKLAQNFWRRGEPERPDYVFDVMGFANALLAARSTIAAPAQEPAYPEGEVVGPCVCGSWPGGKCFKCPRVAAATQEPVAYLSRDGKNSMTVRDFKEHLNNPRWRWVIEKYWTDAIPLGPISATPASTAAPVVPADHNAAQGAGALMTDEEREQLKAAIKVTEYKYFGDYEFSENQRAAVDTLTTFANRMLNCAAPVAPEWQPIETAPLNENVLLWWRPIDDNKYAECAVIGQISFYEQGQWWNGQTGTYQDIWHVTKWMPVPAAPKPAT